MDGADPETTANVAKFLNVDSTDGSVLEALDVDFRTVRPAYVGPELKTYPDGKSDSIWGIRRGGAYYGQALNHPLADVESVADMVESPEVVQAAVEKVVDFYLAQPRMMFEEMADCLDIFFFGNDFGTQKGLICSPSM